MTGRDRRPGELVVVATPIGNIGDLSPRAAATLQQADVVCCEDTRHTGQLLARLGLRASRLLSVHAHNERERVAEVLEMLDRGERVALGKRCRHAGGVRPGRTGDLRCDRRRSQGHDRAGTIGGRERPRGRGARDGTLEI